MESEVVVRIVPNTKRTPTGKLADAELLFVGGPLEGLRLVGFTIWHWAPRLAY